MQFDLTYIAPHFSQNNLHVVNPGAIQTPTRLLFDYTPPSYHRLSPNLTDVEKKSVIVHGVVTQAHTQFPRQLQTCYGIRHLLSLTVNPISNYSAPQLEQIVQALTSPKGQMPVFRGQLEFGRWFREGQFEALRVGDASNGWENIPQLGRELNPGDVVAIAFGITYNLNTCKVSFIPSYAVYLGRAYVVQGARV